MVRAQEKQIRARQGMKQLSVRMKEQRLQALERLRKNMMGNGQPVRILPRDMEQGLKEFASGVEQLVDRLVRCCQPTPQPLLQSCCSQAFLGLLHALHLMLHKTTCPELACRNACPAWQVVAGCGFERMQRSVVA